MKVTAVYGKIVGFDYKLSFVPQLT